MQDPNSPFALSIIEERYDGENLALQVRLRPVTYWEPRAVVVEMQGLRDGELVSSHRFRLVDLLGPGQLGTVADQQLLIPGAPIEFPILFPLQGATDYQLTLLWGEDATYGAHGTTAPLTPLAIVGLRVELLPRECLVPPCPVQYVVEGRLHNESNRAVMSIELAVRFVRRSPEGALDLPSGFTQTAAAEERVVIDEAALAPGAERPFRLVLDQEMSIEEATTVIPSIRVVAAR
jgi:hypothetical protein